MVTPNRNFWRLWGMAALLAIHAGCSIAGTWRTLSVKPDTGPGFPISLITFDDNSMTYASTVQREGRMTISSGSYDWNGMVLRLMPEDGTEQVYRGALWFGQTLTLDTKVDDTSYSAKLERQPVPRDD